VLPEFRRLGVGRALLEAAEARARNLGCCKLTLEVREDNEGARSLYESAGFGDFAPGADPTPTFFLEKRLEPAVR
jgi:ribosomal protein S18 acetylase RimI-like enzyme